MLDIFCVICQASVRNLLTAPLLALQFLLLPTLCCATIAQKVLQQFGNRAYFHLRSCSHMWKSVCNDQLIGVTVNVDGLDSEDVALMNHLPSLTSLTITAKASTEFLIDGKVLDSLTASLRELTVTSGYTEGDDYSSIPQVTVDFLGKLILPWSQVLTALSLECVISPTDSDALTRQGFFAQFPQLTTLCLESLLALPTANSLDLVGCSKLKHLECCGCCLVSLKFAECTGLTWLACPRNLLTTLDLSGHTSLTLLHCSGNKLTHLDLSWCPSLDYLSCFDNQLPVLQISACKLLCYVECDDNDLEVLDVSPCVALTHLCCHHNSLRKLDTSACCILRELWCYSNHLSKLDLSACAALKDLDCKNNLLGDIHLHAEARLDKMLCTDNRGCHILSSGATLLETSCSAATFSFFTPWVRSQLHTLILDASVDTGDLSGFVGLQKLCCHVGPKCIIDLSECTSVELHLQCAVESLHLLGRNKVWKLEITGDLYAPDFGGFTALQELDCDVHSHRSLDLSLCSSLRKAKLDKKSALCVLSSINLLGCSSLVELKCDDFVGLVELDLSACTSLVSVSCVGSSLRSLDVTDCLKLESLDVSKSSQLAKVEISDCSTNLLVLTRLDCPMLIGMNSNRQEQGICS